MPNLNWKLLTKKRASATQGLPSGKEDLAWVANTVTLIFGEHDAVLVDTFLSNQHSQELVDWVVESGKNLTTIYVTHAHGEHYFSLKLLLDKFPNARAIATAPWWTLVIQTRRTQLRCMCLRLAWSSRGMVSTTTRTPILGAAFPRPASAAASGAAGSGRSYLLPRRREAESGKNHSASR